MLQLWEAEETGDGDALSVDQAVDLIQSESATTLVAEIGDEIVGMALGTCAPPIGTVHRLSALDDLPGVLDDLLEQLEARLAEGGARRVGALVAAGGGVHEALERRDYALPEDVAYLSRQVPSNLTVPSGLSELPGRMVSPSLWSELQGLEQAKEIIERRVILPLAKPELAARHAVRPPKAIVLFGPPGTGKTTFARGIASRLGWPYVEIQPAELAGEGAEQKARLLSETFDRVLELGSAVTFVDEVEDLASSRDEERRVSPSVTNEFLRLIPPFREAPHHLLVCATNWVGKLDRAFLRPGRFDYILPVGPPDDRARKAIWRRYTDEITDQEVNLDRIVEASELFTPADIEFAARKAAQKAFEREHFNDASVRASTDDFLAAIDQTNPTLTDEMIAGFEEDMEKFARY